jgi:acyl-CoA synthetase (AMP-forming)/AMP-acid ligase II
MAVAVAKNKELDSQTILATCGQLMPRYKIPHTLLLVPSLPKTSNGKIDKEKCLSLLSHHIQPEEGQDIKNTNDNKGSGHGQH